jgi:hypothetical protein
MAVSDRLSSKVARLADRRLLVVSGTAWLGLAALLFVWRGRFSLAAVANACGREAPDVRFAPAAAQTESFIAGCGAEGLAAYRDLQVVDLFYPAAGAAFLVVVLAYLLGRVAPRAGWLALVPLAAALGDYMENASAWVLIVGASGSSWAASVLQLGSALKVVATWVSWLMVTGLLIGLAVRAPARRRARSGRPAHPGRA